MILRGACFVLGPRGPYSGNIKHFPGYLRRALENLRLEFTKSSRTKKKKKKDVLSGVNGM